MPAFLIAPLGQIKLLKLKNCHVYWNNYCISNKRIQIFQTHDLCPQVRRATLWLRLCHLTFKRYGGSSIFPTAGGLFWLLINFHILLASCVAHWCRVSTVSWGQSRFQRQDDVWPVDTSTGFIFQARTAAALIPCGSDQQLMSGLTSWAACPLTGQTGHQSHGQTTGWHAESGGGAWRSVSLSLWALKSWK